MNVPGWPMPLIVPHERERGCVHDWQRVPPVVHVVGEETSNGGVVNDTYNAECVRCGERAWLHWRPTDPVLEQEC